MTNKSILMATSALAGVALLSNPASAGPTNSGDNFTVTLGGVLGFNMLFYDQDVSAARGRGYSFNLDDAEIHVDAAATADNGLKYGISIELNASPDDTDASDEAWAFVDSDNWGRVEMGAQDDAADRMFINAEAVMAGRVGWDGNLFDVVNAGTGGGVTDSFVSNNGDAVKLIYFTPRMAGFQLGGSLTPDAGNVGRTIGPDNAGTEQNIVDLGINWSGSFSGVDVGVSGTYETGDQDNNGVQNGSVATEDPEIFSLGAQVAYGGFSVAAGYADLGEGGVTTAAAATGADAGEWWNVGVGYTTGPWAVSIAYMETSKSNVSGVSDTEWDIVSAGITYSVAPGWDLQGEINVFEGSNINATAIPVDNDGTVVILSNNFTF